MPIQNAAEEMRMHGEMLEAIRSANTIHLEESGAHAALAEMGLTFRIGNLAEQVEQSSTCELPDDEALVGMFNQLHEERGLDLPGSGDVQMWQAESSPGGCASVVRFSWTDSSGNMFGNAYILDRGRLHGPISLEPFPIEQMDNGDLVTFSLSSPLYIKENFETGETEFAVISGRVGAQNGLVDTVLTGSYLNNLGMLESIIFSRSERTLPTDLVEASRIADEGRGNNSFQPPISQLILEAQGDDWNQWVETLRQDGVYRSFVWEPWQTTEITDSVSGQLTGEEVSILVGSFQERSSGGSDVSGIVFVVWEEEGEQIVSDPILLPDNVVTWDVSRVDEYAGDNGIEFVIRACVVSDKPSSTELWIRARNNAQGATGTFEDSPNCQ